MTPDEQFVADIERHIAWYKRCLPQFETVSIEISDAERLIALARSGVRTQEESDETTQNAS